MAATEAVSHLSRGLHNLDPRSRTARELVGRAVVSRVLREESQRPLGLHVGSRYSGGRRGRNRTRFL
jgi:hypothetical protein